MTFFDMLFGARGWNTSNDVVITGVTRMQGDNVCIAARLGRETIRLHDPSPKEQWLRSIGSLSPGDIASVTWKLPRHHRRPHLEDRDWNPSAFTKVDQLPEEELTKRLSASAFLSIHDAFGRPCFYSDNGNAAFPPNKGSRSLASITVSSVRVYPYGDGARTDFADARCEWTMIPIEDLTVRNHQSHCDSCSGNLAEALAGEFDGSQAILRMGLGRPFQAGDNPPACWLQVNHIFLIPSKRTHFATEGARP